MALGEGVTNPSVTGGDVWSGNGTACSMASIEGRAVGVTRRETVGKVRIEVDT